MCVWERENHNYNHIEMGAAEAALTSNNHHEDEVAVAAQPPLVLGLQPSALVDHVAPVDWSLLNHIPGEHGGSIPVCFSLSLTPYIQLPTN